MEDGIGGAVPLAPDTLIVTFTFNEESYRFESDTAFQDMVSAMQQMKPILGIVPSLGAVPLAAVYDNLAASIIGFEYGQTLITSADEAGKLKLVHTGLDVYYDSETQKTAASIASGIYYVAYTT